MPPIHQMPRPLLLGEVLLDHFPDGRTVLGGAPLNVAWHLQALGARPLLITAVGDDGEGKGILQAMAAWGLDTRGVRIARGWPTGHVHVRLDGPSPAFEIPADQAWDHLTAGPAATTAEDAPALLYHGTLFLRGPGNRALLARVTRDLGLPVFLDLNLRPPWWSPELLRTSLQGVRWLKINAEELAVLAPETSGQDPARRAAALRARIGAEAVFLTLGAAGAVLSRAGETLTASAPAVEVEVVDTVGAGDAFSAIAVLGLLRGWDPARTLDRAVRLATAVCGVPGATPADPALYRRATEDWD